MENVDNVYVQNFLQNLNVKEFCKSVYICQCYDQKLIVFWVTLYVCTVFEI